MAHNPAERQNYTNVMINRSNVNPQHTNGYGSAVPQIQNQFKYGPMTGEQPATPQYGQYFELEQQEEQERARQEAFSRQQGGMEKFTDFGNVQPSGNVSTWMFPGQQRASADGLSDYGTVGASAPQNIKGQTLVSSAYMAVPYDGMPGPLQSSMMPQPGSSNVPLVGIPVANMNLMNPTYCRGSGQVQQFFPQYGHNGQVAAYPFASIGQAQGSGFGYTRQAHPSQMGRLAGFNMRSGQPSGLQFGDPQIGYHNRRLAPVPRDPTSFANGGRSGPAVDRPIPPNGRPDPSQSAPTDFIAHGGRSGPAIAQPSYQNGQLDQSPPGSMLPRQENQGFEDSDMKPFEN